jgi:hypothetical protein
VFSSSLENGQEMSLDVLEDSVTEICQYSLENGQEMSVNVLEDSVIKMCPDLV